MSGPVRESEIRTALRGEVGKFLSAYLLVEEFWVPQSYERADVVVVSSGQVCAFEIKSAKDRLDRLPRQVAAYERLFDLCYVVLAERHLDEARRIVPEWWGLVSVEGVSGAPKLKILREACVHGQVDERALVRLLWRSEAAEILDQLGVSVPPSASRVALWNLLCEAVSPEHLRKIVREALMVRKPDSARIATKRFKAVTC